MSSHPKRPHDRPSDLALLEQLREGDDTVLNELMDRYDRLVRFTVFRCSKARCLRDPSWLDGVASEVWTSLVFAARRKSLSFSQFKSYLIQAARFKTIDALRRCPDEVDASASQGRGLDEPEVVEDAEKWIEELEDLERLRAAVAQLSDHEREVCTCIDLIMDRQWSEAGARLGIAESTLRSRWPRILDRIRSFMNTSDT